MKSSTQKVMEILHQPLNIPTERSLDRREIKLSEIGRICFRGDSRDPDAIFNTGFHVREAITQVLFDNINVLDKKYLKVPGTIDPTVFFQEIDALKKLANTNATAGIVGDLADLQPRYYFNWLSSTVSLLNKNAIQVEPNQEELMINKEKSQTIVRPFFSDHMVATSKRFKSALTFPEVPKDSDKGRSYLYAVYVEKGFDVHMHGVVSGMLNSKTSSQSDIEAVLARANPALSQDKIKQHVENMLVSQKILNITLEEAMLAYAEEIITDSIQKQHIIAAIPVDRELKYHENGEITGTYHLVDKVMVNRNCSLPESTIKTTLAFLQEEIRLNRAAVNSQENQSNATLLGGKDGYDEGLGGLSP